MGHFLLDCEASSAVPQWVQLEYQTIKRWGDELADLVEGLQSEDSGKLVTWFDLAQQLEAMRQKVDRLERMVAKLAGSTAAAQMEEMQFHLDQERALARALSGAHHKLRALFPSTDAESYMQLGHEEFKSICALAARILFPAGTDQPEVVAKLQ